MHRRHRKKHAPTKSSHSRPASLTHPIHRTTRRNPLPLSAAISSPPLLTPAPPIASVTSSVTLTCSDSLSIEPDFFLSPLSVFRRIIVDRTGSKLSNPYAQVWFELNWSVNCLFLDWIFCSWSFDLKLCRLHLLNLKTENFPVLSLHIDIDIYILSEIELKWSANWLFLNWFFCSWGFDLSSAHLHLWSAFENRDYLSLSLYIYTSVCVVCA